MDQTIETGPAEAVSRFNAALAQAGESQRSLMREMTQFARDESLRFTNLRLERTGALIDKLSNSQGVGGLIAAQQEWLRDLIADYAAQNQRVAGALRGVAETMVAQAADAASHTMEQARANAESAMHQTGQAMDQAIDQGQETMQTAMHGMEQQADHAQETQH